MAEPGAHLPTPVYPEVQAARVGVPGNGRCPRSCSQLKRPPLAGSDSGCLACLAIGSIPETPRHPGSPTRYRPAPLPVPAPGFPPWTKPPTTSTRQVLPYTPDVWVKEGATRIGYEISFTRHFYKPQPLRSLEEIRDDIIAAEREVEGVLESLLH